MAKKNGLKIRGRSDGAPPAVTQNGVSPVHAQTVVMPPLRDVAARWEAAGHIFNGFRKNADLVVAKCPKCLNVVSVSVVDAKVVGLDERDGPCPGLVDRRTPIPGWGTPEDLAARDARVQAQNERHRREKKLPNETLEERAVRMQKLSTGSGRAQ